MRRMCLLGDAELGHQLLGGAPRVEEEPAEFTNRPPAAGFRNIRGDGECSARELVPSCLRARPVQASRESDRVASILGRDLVHQEAGGVRAKRHSFNVPLTRPWNGIGSLRRVGISPRRRPFTPSFHAFFARRLCTPSFTPPFHAFFPRLL